MQGTSHQTTSVFQHVLLGYIKGKEKDKVMSKGKTKASFQLHKI